jgi:hypothetical protein
VLLADLFDRRAPLIAAERRSGVFLLDALHDVEDVEDVDEVDVWERD